MQPIFFSCFLCSPSIGIRSKIKRKHRAVRATIHYPVVVQNETNRMVRARAYHTKQTVDKLLEEGATVDGLTEDAKKAIAYAQQLQHVDEQKRALREKGNFFFVHPHAKENVFPVVEVPQDLDVHTGHEHITLKEQENAEAALNVRPL